MSSCRSGKRVSAYTRCIVLKAPKENPTMRASQRVKRRDRDALPPARVLANQAFTRAAGAPLVDGNHIRLLKDARENYPAWLDAIGAARRHVHFESYFIEEDDTGRRFADALI